MCKLGKSTNMKSLLSLSLTLVAACVAEVVVVNTTYGQVMGSNDGTISIFRSIPFAKPPVGDLRFRAPQPPAPWDGIKDVTAFPEPCAQIKIDGNLMLGSEDCLYLQVYVPSQAQSEGPLPVLFWIYGGGYIFGDSEEFGWYDGTNLAKKRGVIIVAVNYRLGPFGFMALDGLQSEDPNHSTGNAALQDQTLAMQWVQDNIANFGGDPKRVMIYGESAGGFSVCWHMVSQASAGLFSSAMMESGSCDTPQFFQTVDFAIEWNTIYADAVGCNASYPAPAGQDPIVACMRSKSTNDLMKSVADWFNPNWPFNNLDGTPVPTGNGPLNMTRYFKEVVKMPQALVPSSLPALAPFMPWGPAIDGTSVGLLDMPLTLLREGKFNKVPFGMGTNANEGSIFIPFFPIIVPGTSFPPSDADLPKFIEHALDMYNGNIVANLTNMIMSFYPPSGDNWARAANILRDMFFTCGTRRTARAVASAGVPTYVYQFSYKLSFEAGLEYDLLGDYHTSELYFVWANEWPPILHTFNADDWQISDAITSYWTNLAATGNPNTGPSTVPVQWPLYNQGSDQNLQLQMPINVTTHLSKTVCDMWDSVANAL